MKIGYVISIMIVLLVAAIFTMVATSTDLESMRLFTFGVGVVLAVTATVMMLAVAAGIDRSN